MNFHFNDWLRRKLAGFEDFNYELESEQDFIKRTTYEPGKVYIVVKMMASDISYGIITQPVQIMIMSEENSLAITQSVFTEIAQNNNFTDTLVGTDYVKFQFTNPVVMSNFNDAMAGYRSLLYMTATLFIMTDVVDVNTVVIDDVTIYPLAFALGYTMTTDTQQINRTGEQIASSVKSVSGLSINMTVPTKYVEGGLLDKILQIINETSTDGGNDTFTISFNVGSINVSKDMKLTAVSLTSAPNNVPSMELGFIK